MNRALPDHNVKEIEIKKNGMESILACVTGNKQMKQQMNG
jgi:hypothetical protein